MNISVLWNVAGVFLKLIFWTFLMLDSISRVKHIYKKKDLCLIRKLEFGRVSFFKVGL